MIEQPGGRTALLVEVHHITLELARQSEHVKKFFEELLGELDPTLSGEESKPIMAPYMSGHREQWVMTHLWLRGLDQIILAVWPHESLLTLYILWSTSFSPAFCLGMIEDYFKTQEMTAHSLVLQADLSVQMVLPTAVVPVG